MYGGAVLDACEQIKARMKPIAEKSTSMTFAEARICYSSNRILCNFQPFIAVSYMMFTTASEFSLSNFLSMGITLWYYS
jgi:xanthine dehydrogenase molybdopterin-binding subunit B